MPPLHRSCAVGFVAAMAVALVCGVRLGVAAVDLDALYIDLPGAVLRLHGLLGAEVGRWLLGGGRLCTAMVVLVHWGPSRWRRRSRGATCGYAAA